MGALGGMILAVLYRSMTWKKLKESVFLTAKATAMVCWLFVGSWTFASIFSYLGGHDVIEHWVVSIKMMPWRSTTPSMSSCLGLGAMLGLRQSRPMT